MPEQDHPFLPQTDLAEEDEFLLQLYEETGRPVDTLAYSEDFERLYNRFKAAGYAWSKSEVFRRLLLLRKAGLLPRLFRRSDSSGEQKSA